MQLGRVSGLLWSIKKLRKQLSETEGAFLLNAASLNPDIYHSDPQLISVAKGRDYEQLPLCLHELAVRFQTFWNRLDEFHERTVRDLLALAVHSTNGDLRMRAMLSAITWMHSSGTSRY